MILRTRLLLILIVFIILSATLTYAWAIVSPAAFPLGMIYDISQGSGLNSLADNLANQEIIKSPFWFKVFSVTFGGLKGTVAGDYVLDKKENSIWLAWRISHGDFRLVLSRITIPEGLNIPETAKLFAAKFLEISLTDFKQVASSSEGYLFPDTYLFLPNISSSEAIKAMKDNFQVKIATVQAEVNTFGKPLSDIIKMASIVELEGRTTETRQIIAGILWKRLALGMPLQVDSSFKYINGKTTQTLTTADLKIDSPYNTYLYKGLPPTPLCNPGLDSIRATIEPTKTAYLYFLTDSKGNMHYAKTYAEHLQNKQMYLQ